MFYFYLMFGEKKMGQIKNKARASKKKKIQSRDDKNKH